MTALAKSLREDPSAASRERFERALGDAMLEHQTQLAAEFDSIHSVERALRVGSLGAITPPARMRAFLIEELERALGGESRV